MIKNHLNIKLLRNVLRQVLRAIDRSVLPSRATEGEHKICKLALYVALHVSIRKGIYIIQKLKHSAICLKKIHNLLIRANKVLVVVIFAWVLNCPAIKYIASSISRCVLRDALLVGK